MGYQISVIMPSLNEEKNIARAVQNVIEGFKALGVTGEIIVINDGSTDATGRIATELPFAYPFVSVVHHDKPQGIGASFWDGVRHASGDVVTMMPGDGENDAAEILRYLPLMEQVDIVVPFIYNRGVRSFRRRMLSILYREIIKASFGLSLNYMNGTVMYRRTIFSGMTLRAGGFFYQTELLVKTILAGYLYAEVPCALLQRDSGESKATTLKSLRKVALSYIGLLREVYGKTLILPPLSPDSVTFLRQRELDKK